MGLHQGSHAQISGHIRLDGEDLVTASPGRVVPYSRKAFPRQFHRIVSETGDS